MGQARAQDSDCQTPVQPAHTTPVTGVSRAESPESPVRASLARSPAGPSEGFVIAAAPQVPVLQVPTVPTLGIDIYYSRRHHHHLRNFGPDP